jgi:ribosomal-protein-alanine N-acetyltransferase
MLILNFTPFPVLQTSRLTLRAMEESDVNELFLLYSDKKVMKYLDKPPVRSTKEVLHFIREIKELEQKNESVNWAITYKGDPELLGTICFWHIKKKDYRAEIGYLLLPAHQHKGIMQEALAAVLNYGFNELKLRVVEANVNPDNRLSIKLLERNGFVKEAYLKGNYFFNNKFLDSVIYSLSPPKKLKDEESFETPI